jgi:hypothetical protein
MTLTALVLGPIVVGLLLYALPRSATNVARSISVSGRSRTGSCSCSR